MTNSKDQVEKPVEEDTFHKEIAKLPPELKEKILSQEAKFKPLVDEIYKRAEGKIIGFYVTALIEMIEKRPTPNFDKLTLHFLYDDFEKPIQYFDPKILLQDSFDNFLVEKKLKDEYEQEYSEFNLKSDENIKFSGISISILRENCFDSIYDDLKSIGTSIVYKDERGFISALKTIDIHRNMLLQKFEKYVVVYAGAGSWLRGEKSNDFDVFIVIDDTDVKRMPRLQVKDQLTKIIWQMSREVAALTGIQIHIQVYLLTDFWDALKDAHPVMFTFLRDGVPFYDRGLYSAWKELLKLGKIKPSPEAIDMHMNVGTQLIDRAKKMLTDIVMNEIYYSVLNPSQAILMLKGYNPTTPKETIRMFKEVLMEKEKIVTAKDVEILEHSIKMFKKIEHDPSTQVSGTEVDKMLKDAEDYLKKIKKMFEEITDDRTKESIVSSYNELLTQIRTLPGYSEISEKDLLDTFNKDFVKSGKFPSFVKESMKSIIKAHKDYDTGKITVTEVNKVLKEMRLVLSEIKSYRDRVLLSESNKRKLTLVADNEKSLEMFAYGGEVYLFDLSKNMSYALSNDSFVSSDVTKESLVDDTKFEKLKLSSKLIDSAKKVLGCKELSL